MTRVKTIDLKGNQYAQVKERLKEFRAKNPNALIETTPTITGETLLFRARILKDKADPNSGEATGNSMGTISIGKDKAFEKLETIAVGRALAFLGYASDGEIASSEEMEEFTEWKQQQLADFAETLKERVDEATSLGELKTIWASVPGDVKPLLEAYKNAAKSKYESK